MKGFDLGGFTLVELLIVVVILSVLAAITVPQFLTLSSDSEKAALSANLKVMRAAVERYSREHNGVYPGANKAFGGGDCNGTQGTGGIRNTLALISQLTLYSSKDGRTCDTKSAIFIYGPYLRAKNLPINPVSKGNTMVLLSSGAIRLRAHVGSVLGNADWLFDIKSGSLIANQENYDRL